eukprot:1139895-Pelagomonas_calceolata.AAC.4
MDPGIIILGPAPSREVPSQQAHAGTHKLLSYSVIPEARSSELGHAHNSKRALRLVIPGARSSQQARSHGSSTRTRLPRCVGQTGGAERKSHPEHEVKNMDTDMIAALLGSVHEERGVPMKKMTASLTARAFMCLARQHISCNGVWCPWRPKHVLREKPGKGTP